MKSRKARGLQAKTPGDNRPLAAKGLLTIGPCSDNTDWITQSCHTSTQSNGTLGPDSPRGIKQPTSQISSPVQTAKCSWPTETTGSALLPGGRIQQGNEGFLTASHPRAGGQIASKSHGRFWEPPARNGIGMKDPLLAGCLQGMCMKMTQWFWRWVIRTQFPL